MNDKIINKIYEAFDQYNTDCLTGILTADGVEPREVIIVRVYCAGKESINFIGNTGINITLFYSFMGDSTEVSNLKDIANRKGVFE